MSPNFLGEGGGVACKQLNQSALLIFFVKTIIFESLEDIISWLLQMQQKMRRKRDSQWELDVLRLAGMVEIQKVNPTKNPPLNPLP